MIWIDSSFAIEWLLGTRSAKMLELPAQALSILPQQYAEVLVYFYKAMSDISPVVEQLEYLSLGQPERVDLVLACQLYGEARRKKSKASLSDAILAAVASNAKSALLSFDGDFHYLGFVEETTGVWRARSR